MRRERYNAYKIVESCGNDIFCIMSCIEKLPENIQFKVLHEINSIVPLKELLNISGVSEKKLIKYIFMLLKMLRKPSFN